MAHPPPFPFSLLSSSSSPLPSPPPPPPPPSPPPPPPPGELCALEHSVQDRVRLWAGGRACRWRNICEDTRCQSLERDRLGHPKTTSDRNDAGAHQYLFARECFRSSGTQFGTLANLLIGGRSGPKPLDALPLQRNHVASTISKVPAPHRRTI